jgi:hypothetical protein
MNIIDEELLIPLIFGMWSGGILGIFISAIFSPLFALVCFIMLAIIGSILGIANMMRNR